MVCDGQAAAYKEIGIKVYDARKPELLPFCEIGNLWTTSPASNAEADITLRRRTAIWKTAHAEPREAVPLVVAASDCRSKFFLLASTEQLFRLAHSLFELRSYATSKITESMVGARCRTEKAAYRHVAGHSAW